METSVRIFSASFSFPCKNDTVCKPQEKTNCNKEFLNKSMKKEPPSPSVYAISPLAL